MAYSQLLLVLFAASNLIYYLNGQYVGTPTTTADLKAVLKHSLELKCEYTGDDANGQFLEWYKDDVSVNTEKPGHYLVKTKEKESILIIKLFVAADAEVKNWYVKTGKPGYEEPQACRFNQIALKSSPQGMETNRVNEKLDSAHGSIRRKQDELVILRCIIEPKPEIQNQSNPIQWQFSKDDQSFTNLPDGVAQKDNELTIDRIQKAHRGYYRCSLNDVSFTVLLRVKDLFAALWPFIGIVSVVLLLVVVIVIFEKRQKTKKKLAAAEEDEHDQANDPLVRTTVKSSDNENRKRTVKA